MIHLPNLPHSALVLCTVMRGDHTRLTLSIHFMITINAFRRRTLTGSGPAANHGNLDSEFCTTA